MTPEQKLKHMILNRYWIWTESEQPEVTAENVDRIYEETNGEDCELQDACQEIRCCGIETNIPAPSSRHYESDEVAAQALDGSWIGWTYWHGGGKHGEPDAVDWMCYAYDLECKEEEKLVVVRTFTKID